MKKKEFRLEKFDYADYKANQLEDDGCMHKVLSILGEASNLLFYISL
jgi:hypothetical protein